MDSRNCRRSAPRNLTASREPTFACPSNGLSDLLRLSAVSGSRGSPPCPGGSGAGVNYTPLRRAGQAWGRTHTKGTQTGYKSGLAPRDHRNGAGALDERREAVPSPLQRAGKPGQLNAANNRTPGGLNRTCLPGVIARFYIPGPAGPRHPAPSASEPSRRRGSQGAAKEDPDGVRARERPA